MLDLRKDVYIYTLTRVHRRQVLRQRNYSDARRNEVGVLKFKEETTESEPEKGEIRLVRKKRDKVIGI